MSTKRNIGKFLFDLIQKKKVLNYESKTRFNKKYDKFDYFFKSMVKIHHEVKKQLTNWKQTFAVHAIDKGLIQLTYEEDLKNEGRKTNNPIEI